MLVEQLRGRQREPAFDGQLLEEGIANAHAEWWILRTKQRGKKSSCLLYAWILVGAGVPYAGWKSKNIDDDFRPLPGADCSVRLTRLTLGAPAASIVRLLETLATGKSLQHAAKEAGQPLKSTINSELRDLRLGSSESALSAQYALGPTVFVGSVPVSAALRSSPSPSTQPAISASLTLLNKSHVFSPSGQTNDRPVLHLLGPVLDALKGETGLDFKRSSAGRIGNIEWLYFRTSQPYPA